MQSSYNKNHKKTYFMIISLFAIIFAVAAGIFLFGFHGIRSGDFYRKPIPENSYNICLSSNDILTQDFVSDTTSMRGVSLYPIVDEGISGSLFITVTDMTDNSISIADSSVFLSEIESSEWNFIPARCRLKSGHVYELSYRLSEDATSDIWLVMYGQDQQNLFNPYIQCETSNLNGEPIDGCIFQVLHIMHPTGFKFNALLFILLILATIALLSFTAAKLGIFDFEQTAFNSGLLSASEKFRSFFYKYVHHICMAATILVAIIIRLSLIKLESGDYTGFLLPWVEHYRLLGVKDGLAMLPGNYYVPYNLLLAISSVLPFEPYWSIAFYAFIGDAVIAIFGSKLVKLILEETGLIQEKYIETITYITGMLLLVFPPIFFDSAAWKQADTIYIGFLIASVYYVGKNRYFCAFVFWGVSFIFKLQAMFLLPLFIILWFCKNFKLRYFLIPPAFYILAGLPAIFCGAEPGHIYQRYFEQSQENPVMTVMFPNVYALGINDYEWLSLPAILFTFFCFVLLFLICIKHKEMFSRIDLIAKLTTLTFWICIMFLPKMHQRYGLFVTILLLIIFLSNPKNRKSAIIALMVTIVEILEYTGYLFPGDDGVTLMIQSIINITAFVLFIQDFLDSMKYISTTTE